MAREGRQWLKNKPWETQIPLKLFCGNFPVRRSTGYAIAYGIWSLDWLSFSDSNCLWHSISSSNGRREICVLHQQHWSEEVSFRNPQEEEPRWLSLLRHLLRWRHINIRNNLLSPLQFLVSSRWEKAFRCHTDVSQYAVGGSLTQLDEKEITE